MKDDSIYVDHILLSVKNILDYTKDISREEFSKNTLIQDAVIRNFEIIGEATKKVSSDFRRVYFKVPWKEMAGMRDKLIHDYIGVDTQVIWDTIEQDLPIILKLLKEI
jgi:uncharacterized protein with HEPN domain